mmetsp:Transcript_20004/g.42027  ORF Transcript_20004/g.42027 Transcript_20004/m.42027 type:complete len:184 (-) Transcript_20004:163-714(-)|eukprot:CAMPEP_0171432564 /NCGR_PEP_ID=MMETSP0881-20121228/7989_1 /TAXON_ID=67004 /ORGANISM="Thalassiosira weissflogii, Strain CCMP1336" /LENGTH=183 /DNA_ID=CAMNT_0011953043 /DNA_START=23 /DNA_END=574 /DNA_ORIENTATION=+
MEQKSKPPRIKIISVGNMKVGKSCLIKKYCEKNRSVSNYIPTIGVDYGVKATTTKFNGGRISEVKIDFFDFSGDSNYSEVRNEFYDNVDGVIFMYDVTNKESFTALRSWLKEAGKYGVSHSNATIAVVGNKIDQYPRAVTENDGAKFAAENNAAYFETSAKTVATIDDLFDYLISSKFDDSKR